VPARRDCFPGGCFLSAAAVGNGELSPGTDPEQVAFELGALAVGANHERQLHGDPHATDRALTAMLRVLEA
jgi:hypothetical protein